jgi:hypothetical protein
MWAEKNPFLISSMPDHFEEIGNREGAPKQHETARDSGKEGDLQWT